MKLSVHIRGEIIAVPCGKGLETIKWLGEQALKRFAKLKPTGDALSLTADQILETRKTNGGALLDSDDQVKDVLDDNDFITIGEFPYA